MEELVKIVFEQLTTQPTYEPQHNQSDFSSIVAKAVEQIK